MSIRMFFVVSMVFVSSCTDRDATPDSMMAGTWIDLTHELADDAIFWPTADEFRLRVDAKGFTKKGYFYSSNSFEASEHGGTHIDAPIHFAEGKLSLAQIPIDQLMGAAAVIDVKDKAARDANYQVTQQDLEDWEAKHGRLSPIVLLNTGFHNAWPNRVRYLGTDERGEAAVRKLHFPGLHRDAAKWLVEERSVHAIGIDTASIDYGQSQEFMSHRILLGNNVPAFENVANLDALPASGAWVIALPTKIRDGTGGPLRIVARIGHPSGILPTPANLHPDK